MDMKETLQVVFSKTSFLTKGTGTEGVNHAQRGDLLWIAVPCLTPCAEPKAPAFKYLAKSSSRVSGISSLGFPRVELNFSFSLSTNSLNSFAQTFEKRRQKCHQFLRVEKNPSTFKVCMKILVAIAEFWSQKQYNSQGKAGKSCCSLCLLIQWTVAGSICNQLTATSQAPWTYVLRQLPELTARSLARAMFKLLLRPCRLFHVLHEVFAQSWLGEHLLHERNHLWKQVSICFQRQTLGMGTHIYFSDVSLMNNCSSFKQHECKNRTDGLFWQW